MPRAKATPTPRPSKKTEEAEPKEPRYSGPWYRVEADAQNSKNFTGKVDLGTYTEPERKAGRVTKRIEALNAQGYKNIDVREALSA